jgi:hypothetical protein
MAPNLQITMKNKNLIVPELCYGLLDSEMLDPTVKQVIPIIIKRAEKGYYLTDWKWSKEFAAEARDQKNAALGVTPELAEKMLVWSMFGWPDFVYQQQERETDIWAGEHELKHDCDRGHTHAE